MKQTQLVIFTMPLFFNYVILVLPLLPPLTSMSSSSNVCWMERSIRSHFLLPNDSKFCKNLWHIRLETRPIMAAYLIHITWDVLTTNIHVTWRETDMRQKRKKKLYMTAGGRTMKVSFFFFFFFIYTPSRGHTSGNEAGRLPRQPAGRKQGESNSG